MFLISHEKSPTYLFINLAGDNTPAKILDLCCGQGRHLLHLNKEYSHLDLYGHDQSSYLISLAKERVAMSNPNANIQFSVGDCRQIPYPDNHFDLILVMGNSFGYFHNDDGDIVVLNEIFRVLSPGGRMVLDLTDGEWMRRYFAERSWEWVDDSCFVCRERQLSKDGKKLCSREVITHTDTGVVRDQFYQERLYSRKEIENLVRNVGLTVISEIGTLENPGPVITTAKELSKRNEDLGMMEQRMLVKAIKPMDDFNMTPVQTTVNTHDFKYLKDTPSLSLTHDVNRTPIENFVAQVKVDLKQNDHNDNHTNGVITSSPHSNITSLQSFNHSISTILVVLGDPSLPCFGKLNNTWNEEDIMTRKKLMQALRSLGIPHEKIHFLENHAQLIQTLSTVSPSTSFVLNFCDEGFANDALQELHVPALLEMLNLPYSGAGPNCLGVCYDKGLVNRTAKSLGVPVPKETYFTSDQNFLSLSDLALINDRILGKVGYPAFIKPLKGDNSLGITEKSIVRNLDDVRECLKILQDLGIKDVIIQEFLQGTEYGVGMVGNLETGFHFFPIMEVDFSSILHQGLVPILGYDSKWDPSSPYWTDVKFQPAQLSSSIETSLRKYCLLLWERFGCRDYARFDFRCSIGKGDGLDGLNGIIKLLEVNPNPGWCWDGKFAHMAEFEDKSYVDMLKMILEASFQRYELKSSSSSSKMFLKSPTKSSHNGLSNGHVQGMNGMAINGCIKNDVKNGHVYHKVNGISTMNSTRALNPEI